MLSECKEEERRARHQNNVVNCYLDLSNSSTDKNGQPTFLLCSNLNTQCVRHINGSGKRIEHFLHSAVQILSTTGQMMAWFGHTMHRCSGNRSKKARLTAYFSYYIKGFADYLEHDRAEFEQRVSAFAQFADSHHSQNTMRWADKMGTFCYSFERHKENFMKHSPTLSEAMDGLAMCSQMRWGCGGRAFLEKNLYKNLVLPNITYIKQKE